MVRTEGLYPEIKTAENVLFLNTMKRKTHKTEQDKDLTTP